MPTIEDVKVTLTFSCEVGNNLYNEDVLVNFYEDKTTVLEISRVLKFNILSSLTNSTGLQ